MKKFIFLAIALLAMLFCGGVNRALAKDNTSTSFSIETILNDCFDAWQNLGKKLESAGFTMKSKKNIQIPSCEDPSPGIRKTYSKNGTTVKYEYYPDNYVITKIVISFTSKDSYNKFRESILKYTQKIESNGDDEAGWDQDISFFQAYGCDGGAFGQIELNPRDLSVWITWL